jgi:squalene monooxygenase
MGGLIENPFLLFYYFFGIAIYSMWLHLRQATILGLPGVLIRSILVFVNSVRIIFPSLLDELRF